MNKPELESKTIKVRIETHYGRRTIYPVCPIAKIFASIAKTKTLTESALERIQALGYSIVPIAPQLNLEKSPSITEGAKE